MACTRVNGAKCLTRLAMKNIVRGVYRFLKKMDPMVPMEIFISIPFASLPRPIVDYMNVPKETTDIAEYILNRPKQHDHLSFAALGVAHQIANERWTYAVHPLYSVILHCDRVNAGIVRLILKSDIIDSFETQIRVIR